ncbi:MAG: hypothetical protein AAF519_06225 [Bacteroidota bacterium]
MMNLKASFFRYLFFMSLTVIMVSCGDDDEDPQNVGEANVRLFEVDVEASEIVIRNFGDASIDVSGFYICNLKSYAQLNTLTTDDLILDPNETVTLARVLNASASDVGLYFNNDGFANADNLADFMQYGNDLGASGRIDVAVAKGIWTAGDFVEGNIEFGYTGNGTESGESFWNSAGSNVPTGSANVRITSVNPGADAITLRNFGDASTDISAYQFCARKNYAALGNLTSGDLNLDPDEEVTITFTIDDNSSDLGLYITGGAFADPASMLDFMQYGDNLGDDGRVNVAVAKGIWSDGDFVNGVGPYSYAGDGDEDGLENWEVTEEGESLIRLFDVDPISNTVTLKNFGTASKDISTYWFCARFDYNQLSDLGTTGGNSILAPQEEVTISVTIDDHSSDLGFYNADSFGSSEALVDFIQYGDAGIGRESVAESKGIWTAGDFISGVAPYSYQGSGAENGLENWDAAEEGEANIRLLQVDPIANTITLRNFGNASKDISSYWFCLRFSYNQVSTLTAQQGNFILAPTEEVVISVDMNDTSSDVGFYSTDIFASSEAMSDFMQYGEGGIGRESVAESKGIWTAGDFVENPGPFTYNGDGTATGASTWQ